MEKQQAKEQYQKLKEDVKTSTEPEERKEKQPPDIPVDFKKLKETNQDIYAWITIPGTGIDYPVVQNKEDNGFYLDHSADKSESVNGAVFSENYNNTEFDDHITVLYGHNMRDGSMFAGLHLYEDSRFLEEHNEITIYTPDSILKYRIFAAYRTDDKHVLLYYNQGKDMYSRKAYLNEIMGQRTMYSYVDSLAEPDEDSKILTLSTCDKAGDTYRYLVQAYLTEKR